VHSNYGGQATKANNIYWMNGNRDVAVTKLFGARVKRKEDPRLITGKGRFTADFNLPGTLYVHFVRSRVAHGRIKSVDVSKALKVEGVVAVLTGADLMDGLGTIPTAWQIPGADLKTTPYRPVAVDKVRYVGDPYAVVVARSPYAAADAAELVRAEIEPLPAVVDPEKAVQPGAPQLYDEVPNNTAFVWRASGGDVDEAFSRAEVVVRQRMVNTRLQPTAMETRAAMATYDRFSDRFTLYVTSQNPHVHRLLLSLITGIPEHKLRVISADVGGGFGSKIHVYGPEAVVLHLARKLEVRSSGSRRGRRTSSPRFTGGTTSSTWRPQR
jgi:carbon-monoxide dehydrogenase large subunit